MDNTSVKCNGWNGVAQDADKDDLGLCFFAYLDILGFKSLVKQKSFDQLRKIVDDFTIGCRETVDSSRTINAGNATFRIELSHINVRIVSDSIYVWSGDAEYLKQFEDVLHIVNAMLASGLKHGLPLRGAVTFGEIFIGETPEVETSTKDFSFENGALYGKALVEAYEFEGEMDWSGAILTPKAWAKIVEEFACGKNLAAKIENPQELFNHFPYLLWYDIPFKSGGKKSIAFNWNYRPTLNLSEEKIKKAFIGQREDVNDDVQQKLNETLRFFKYTQHVAELCKAGNVKTLPVVDDTYVSQDLNTVVSNGNWCALWCYVLSIMKRFFSIDRSRDTRR